jgi:hypothetical protein
MLSGMPPGLLPEQMAHSDDRRQEALAILGGLAVTLADGPPDNSFREPESLQINAESALARAWDTAMREGPASARRLLLEERDRLTQWRRAVTLGLVRDDSGGPGGISDALRARTAALALGAAYYGLDLEMPPGQLMTEVAAAGYGQIEDGVAAEAMFLAKSHERLGRPELAVSILIRSPIAEPAAHLRYLLNLVRVAYAEGHGPRLAELLRVDPWSDDTGLARSLVARFVTERPPTQADLQARAVVRGQAMNTQNWPALRQLVLSDVMWLEETSTLWMALAGILNMTSAPAAASLAQGVADLIARDETGTR